MKKFLFTVLVAVALTGCATHTPTTEEEADFVETYEITHGITR